VAGSENIVADLMSRLPLQSPPLTTQNGAACGVPLETISVVEATSSHINYTVLADHQTSCPDVAATARHSSLRVRAVTIQNVEVLCDVSTGTARPLIPTQGMFLQLSTIWHIPAHVPHAV
jgi:hypothetical protein